MLYILVQPDCDVDCGCESEVLIRSVFGPAKSSQTLNGASVCVRAVVGHVP